MRVTIEEFMQEYNKNLINKIIKNFEQFDFLQEYMEYDAIIFELIAFNLELNRLHLMDEDSEDFKYLQEQGYVEINIYTFACFILSEFKNYEERLRKEWGFSNGN